MRADGSGGAGGEGAVVVRVPVVKPASSAASGGGDSDSDDDNNEVRAAEPRTAAAGVTERKRGASEEAVPVLAGKSARLVPDAVWPRLVWAGAGQVEAAHLEDSTGALLAGDAPGLRARLREDGYLFLRGVLDRDRVLEARSHVLHALHDFKPQIFLEGTPIAAAQAAPGAAAVGLLGRQDIARAEPVRRVLEADALFRLMQSMLESDDIVTTGFKWLRAVAPSEFTGVHTDRVFLGRGSGQLITAWLPLGDCPTDQGTMMVIPRSHTLPELTSIRDSYGQSEVGKDGTRSGWLTDNGRDVEAWLREGAATGAASLASSPKWHTADFKAGDIILLRLDTLHMSAANRSSRLRISCDTRWLPADEPRDPRLTVWNAQREGGDGGRPR